MPALKSFYQSFSLFIIALFCVVQSYATHNRAGEIIYRTIAPFTIDATIITYTKVSDNSGLADRDSLTLEWGDGTFSVLPRNNGPNNKGVLVGNDIKKNTYEGTHVYPGAPPPPNNYYVLWMRDLNRIDNIININNSNSIDIPFYIEDTLRFPTSLPNLGFNSSPILTLAPIDYGCVNDTFFHNPAAYDPDGDSLVFSLVVPNQGVGVLVPNYVYPDQVIPGPNNRFTIDSHTGQIVWATPQQAGIYNIAIVVKEYRRGILMGALRRDMEIIVNHCTHPLPHLIHLNDTCVRAGDTLKVKVNASDSNLNDTVTLTNYGAPFFVPIQPATFNSTPANPVSGDFFWATVCDDIQGQPYEAVFKAEVDYTVATQTANEVDIDTWLIRVVAPPPENLQITVTGNSATLTWDNPYKCASFNHFRGFSIWRRINSNPFVPDYCEIGLAGRGYEKIADSVQTYSYVDNNLKRGNKYCYRILANFSKLSPNKFFEWDKVESVTSTEFCIELPFDVPVITKVSVAQTDAANGIMNVEWTKPKTGGKNLDTIKDPAPYIFKLYRSSGFNISSPILVTTKTFNSYSGINDTTYTDNGLDTKDNPYSYKVTFLARNGTDSIGESNPASSVYLNAYPSDKTLTLAWSENVPWLNDSFTVYKQNKTTGLYDSVALVYTETYADSGLINDSTYCYQVKSWGHYGDSSVYRPLLNLSEQKCAVPKDTTPPCPPVLTVTNDCEQYLNKRWTNAVYENNLVWMVPPDSCGNKIAEYRIYYANDTVDLHVIDSVVGLLDTVYKHILNDNLAGCYAVSAVNRSGLESKLSNVFCIDNCPYYDLPNTFTPNGDGHNDLFTPYKPYRFVPKIEMHIFNRWGNKVFETQNPDIDWDGNDLHGKPCSDGVYLYGGFYYELHRDGLHKRPLPPNKNGGGFIHLMR